MSNQKYKSTGFTRFLLFLIFFIPVAWIAFTIGSGKDVKQEFGVLANKIGIKSTPSKVSTSSNVDYKSALEEKEIYILQLEKRLQKCENALKESTGN